MGLIGSGLAMKLVVNTLLGVGMQSIAEALALGTGLGIQHDALREFTNGGESANRANGI
jgi:3-hydroxyisobutyrate dehydrogenase-like beta-hydroxyacid dehydrogenase